MKSFSQMSNNIVHTMQKAKVATGPFINDHGDCQVPTEFYASRLLQTDSEVLLADSNFT